LVLRSRHKGLSETLLQIVMSQIEIKFNKLKEILLSFESVMLAYSGGVDSTFLLKVSKEVLGNAVVAVTAVSPLYPAHEIEQAVNSAIAFNATHLTLENNALSDSAFVNNSPDRCYICKKNLFLKIQSLAAQKKYSVVIDGTNADDKHCFRPGMRALEELGIRSPLKDSDLTKDDIRVLSKKLGLSTWNKPSCACLASRFPYGVKIIEADLIQVEKAESFMRKKYRDIQVRVRHYGDTARIEVFPEQFDILLDKRNRNEIITTFKNIGYTYVTFDLEGYRTGSMDEVL